jgi:hypothetical protein
VRLCHSHLSNQRQSNLDQQSISQGKASKQEREKTTNATSPSILCKDEVFRLGSQIIPFLSSSSSA